VVFALLALDISIGWSLHISSFFLPFFSTSVWWVTFCSCCWGLLLFLILFQSSLVGILPSFLYFVLASRSLTITIQGRDFISLYFLNFNIYINMLVLSLGCLTPDKYYLLFFFSVTLVRMTPNTLFCIYTNIFTFEVFSFLFNVMFVLCVVT